MPFRLGSSWEGERLGKREADGCPSAGSVGRGRGGSGGGFHSSWRADLPGLEGEPGMFLNVVYLVCTCCEPPAPGRQTLAQQEPGRSAGHLGGYNAILSVFDTFFSAFSPACWNGIRGESDRSWLGSHRQK